MNRLQRLTALISFLQSNSFSGVKEIRERFQISERTVYRDIKSLNASGIPIAFEQTKGYYIMSTYYLPPLSLTLEEAKSFVFMEQLAKKYADADMFKNYSNALDKIKISLKPNQIKSIEALQNYIKVHINSNYIPKYLQRIEEAISKKIILDLVYVDQKNIKTFRSIEPIGITFYNQMWHLIAFCQLRDDYRDFSIDRIEKIAPTNQTIKNKRFSLEDYINHIKK